MFRTIQGEKHAIATSNATAACDRRRESLSPAKNITATTGATMNPIERYFIPHEAPRHRPINTAACQPVFEGGAAFFSSSGCATERAVSHSRSQSTATVRYATIASSENASQLTIRRIGTLASKPAANRPRASSVGRKLQRTAPTAITPNEPHRSVARYIPSCGVVRICIAIIASISVPRGKWL